MCGRFALDYSNSVLNGWYRTKTMPELIPRYNIAPTSIVLAIRESIHGREGALMRWGLIPRWAKDTKNLPIHNNARAEAVVTNPTFKYALSTNAALFRLLDFMNGNYCLMTSTSSPTLFQARLGFLFLSRGFGNLRQ